MREALRRSLGRPLNHSLVRFLLVGFCGEALYLGLYALVWRLSGHATTAIAIAGSTCLVLNAVLHARFSFRVRLHPALVARYGLIQLLCLLLSLLAGRGLELAGTPPLWVALITLVLWSGTSFVLTRRGFRPQRLDDAGGLASRHTSS